MAVTQNTYTGNGSTVLYSFTFPYLETTDIKVSVNGSTTTAYTLASPTTVQFNTAPTNGASIRIYRETDDSGVAATFFPGSAIRSQDLNDNFTQNLYVTQESSNNSAAATTTANSALAASASATSTSNTALSQSSTALSNSTAAVSTSNTASANATTALSQSSTAITTANNSQATANSASSTAASALSASATATSNASTALSQSNTALSNSSTALSQSNTALSNSANAVTTSGTASTNASTALTTANTANNKADQAIAAVSSSINYTLVATVAAIPATPANNTYIEVSNSTGLESFTPLTGKPAGFVGDSGLTVRLVYTTAGTTWNWLSYFPNNAETRYLKLAGGTLTGPLTLAGAPSSNLHPATKAYVDGYVNSINGDIGSLSSTKLDSTTAASTYQTQAGMSSYLTTANAASTYLTTANASSTYMPKSGGTFTGSVILDTGSAHSIKGGQVVLNDSSGNYTGTLQTASGSLALTGGVELGINNTGTGGSGKFRVNGTTGDTVITGSLTVGGSSVLVSSSIGTTVQSYDADTVKTDVIPTFTVATRTTERTITAGAFDLSTGNLWTCGAITVPNPTNAVAGQTGAIRITAGPVVWSANFKFPGGTAPTIATFPAVIPYYVSGSSTILMGNAVAGIA